MKLIDTHCHLYLKEFRQDVENVINNAEKEGVEKFYLPAIDSSETANMLALEEQFPGKCFSMIGLHPCSVKENHNEELSFIESWLRKRPFVAIGEIGLDFYWDKTFTDQQYEAFHKQIELALHYKLPIVVHSRNAMDETISVLKEYKTRGLTGIFHCFSGSYQNAVEIVDAGFYLGIGGVITYKNSGLSDVVDKIGIEHLVLETDAPYLSPVPFRGKRNESGYLKYIVQKIAEVKGISQKEAAETTTKNAEKIFGS